MNGEFPLTMKTAIQMLVIDVFPSLQAVLTPTHQTTELMYNCLQKTHNYTLKYYKQLLIADYM